jgi:protein required for attachment to host cells
LKRKHVAAAAKDDSSSNTGSDDGDNAYKQYIPEADVTFFNEIKQRQEVKQSAVDSAVWKKKKARLAGQEYMYLNKNVHYIEYNRLILGKFCK